MILSCLLSYKVKHFKNNIYFNYLYMYIYINQHILIYVLINIYKIIDIHGYEKFIKI